MAQARARQSSRCQLLLKRVLNLDDPTIEFHDIMVPAQSSPEDRSAGFILKYFDSKTLPVELLDWSFDLVKGHLYDLYLPVWGWSDEEKRKQLSSPASRFLVAFAPSAADASSQGAQPAPDQAAATPATEPASVQGPGAGAAVLPANLQGHGVPAAFINFRFEPGYFGEPVLYVYEVMVEVAFQRQGLGTRMMGLMEALAWNFGMDSIVLTEFSANKAAASLYRKLGYTRDKASPANKGYEILSKQRESTEKSSKKGKSRK